MLRTFACALIPLASLACLASMAPASAQSATFHVITPANFQATDISDDGVHVVGTNGTDSFRWSAAAGLEQQTGGEAWGTSADASLLAGDTQHLAKKEAGLWTAGTGWVPQGNAGGVAGCDTSVSWFDDLTPDGQWAAGSSWQGCKTWGVKWNAVTGFQLLPKQLSTASAKAWCVSDDGQTVGGWETAAFGFKRGVVWMPDGTEVSLLVTAANPDGAGEVVAMSGDASVMCGVSNTSKAFLWTQAGGVQLLPAIAGVGGNYTALDASADGTVVVGKAVQGLSQTAWIWTAAHGTQTMLSYLQAKGVPGLSASMMLGATGISDDGLTICGWGGTGAWVAQLDSPWTDLGHGLAGAGGVPSLAGSGTLQPGSDLLVSLSGALGSAPATLVVGFTQLDAPFKGGVLVPDVDLLLAGFVTTGSGGIPLAATWPTGLPSGFDTFFQWWIADAAGPKGVAASNGLRGRTP